MLKFEAAKKIVFRRYIIHLPDLMAAFIKSYEKNVNESVKNPDCLGNCWKALDAGYLN